MKTPEEIKEYLKSFMTSMLRRPLMYADTPLSLECQFLNLVDVLLFINDDNSLRTNDRWRKFAHEKICYSGVFPVSTYLENKKDLGEDWSGLTMLLGLFLKSLMSS